MRKLWRFAGVLLTGMQFASVAMAQRVITESGAISGVREGGLSVYKGVPFAGPPVGDLRWPPRQSVAPWRNTRKADAFAPACMQTGVSMPGETPPVVSEDCLYLNIWTPAKKAQEHLPVIAWIYGGGYINGSASMYATWAWNILPVSALIELTAVALFAVNLIVTFTRPPVVVASPLTMTTE